MDVVSLVDVAPTLLDWLEIDRPDSFEGRSFRSDLIRQRSWWRVLLAARADEPRTAYSELIRDADHRRLSPHERALVMGSKKLIVGVGGEGEFYDTQRDPREQNPDGLPAEDRTTLWRTLAGVQKCAAVGVEEEDAPPRFRDAGNLAGLGLQRRMTAP